MIDPSEYADTGPTCFVQQLDWEWRRIRSKHLRYIFRYMLSKYPKDLLSSWWKNDGSMPFFATQFAFKAYKAGIKPGEFRLYKGPLHFPKFTLMDGGKSGRALTLGKQ
jgi:hypothetical protein